MRPLRHQSSNSPIEKNELLNDVFCMFQFKKTEIENSRFKDVATLLC